MSSLSHVFARLRALPDGARGHEALRRGLGGTAVLGSSGFTAVARALWEPMRRSRATFTMRPSRRQLGTGTSAGDQRAKDARAGDQRAKDARAGGQPPMEPVRQTVLWGQLAQLFTPPAPGE